MGLISRVASFCKRLRMLNNYSANGFAAARSIFRHRSDPYRPETIRYENIPFIYRGVDERAIREVWFDGEYDFASEYVRTNPRPIVYDLGAHIGCFGAWVFSRNSRAVVVSYEANPSTHAVLQANAEQYVLAGNLWETYCRAVTDGKNQVIKLQESNNSMSCRVSKTGNVYCKSATLQMIVNRPIDLLKLDIEGSEQGVLEEGQDSLMHVKALIIEIHPSLCKESAVKKILGKYFSKIKQIAGRESAKPLLFCEKPNS